MSKNNLDKQDFSDQVTRSLKILKCTPVDSYIGRLVYISKDYEKNKKIEKSTPTISMILNELKFLSEKLERKEDVIFLELSKKATSVLLGHFPSSRASLVGDNTQPYYSDSHARISGRKFRSNYFQKDGSSNIFELSRSEPPNMDVFDNVHLDPADMRPQRLFISKNLSIFDVEKRSQLLENVKYAVERLKTTFRVGKKSGKISIRSHYSSSVEWTFLKEIVQCLGLEHSYPLSKEAKIALDDIIIATSQNNGATGKYYFNSKILKTIILLEYQIYKLNGIINLIEDRKFSIVDAYMHSNGAKCQKREFEGPLFKKYFLPLRAWRRELERRLYYGDYQPTVKSYKRLVDGQIKLPKFPILRRDDLIWKQIRALTRSIDTWHVEENSSV